MLTALVMGTMIAQERTVTFTHPCARADVVLAAFGEAVGETIRPSASVKNDYFMVHFVDVPVSVAFDKIAETLIATWNRGEKTTYLTRTATDLTEEKRLESARFRELLKKGSKERPSRSPMSEQEVHELLRTGVDSDKSLASHFVRHPDTPSNQFVGDVYRWLLKNKIGLHDFKSSVILSERPGWLSRRMPNGFEELHRKHNDLKEIWSAAENRLNSDSRLSTRTFDSFWSDRRWDMDGLKHRVELYASGEYYWFNIVSYGNGEGDGTRGHGLFWIPMPDSDVTVPEDIQYGEEYLALADGWMFGFDDGGGHRPAKERSRIMELLRDHPNSDMLGHVVSPALTKIAQATDMNVVALLSDSQLMYYGAPSMLILDDINQFEFFLEGWGTEKIDKEDSFIQVSPMWPSLVRKERFDRAALVAAIEAVVAKEKAIPALAELLYGGDTIRHNLSLGETLGILTSVSYTDYSPFIYSGDRELLMLYQGVRGRMTKRGDSMQFSGTLMDLPEPFRREAGRYLLQLYWSSPDESDGRDDWEVSESAIDTLLSRDGLKTRFTLTYAKGYMHGYDDHLEETMNCEFELVNGLIAQSRLENGTGLHIRLPSRQQSGQREEQR